MQPALEVCGRCAVAVECLAFAMTDPDAFESGVWGGTSPTDRKRLRKAKKDRQRDAA